MCFGWVNRIPWAIAKGSSSDSIGTIRPALSLIVRKISLIDSKVYLRSRFEDATSHVESRSSSIWNEPRYLVSCGWYSPTFSLLIPGSLYGKLPCTFPSFLMALRFRHFILVSFIQTTGTTPVSIKISDPNSSWWALAQHTGRHKPCSSSHTEPETLHLLVLKFADLIL